jgi:ketosteroid isomerase-like protein
MSGRIFPTSQDCESAFYEALERADLELMMAVWAEDEEIVCIHPGGPRLCGQDAVRESWAQIFAGGARMRVHVSQQVTVNGMMLAVHSVFEAFSMEGAIEGAPGGEPARDSRPPPIVATNVYLRSPSGWRMVVHHASPAPGKAEPPPAPKSAPRLFH